MELWWNVIYTHQNKTKNGRWFIVRGIETTAQWQEEVVERRYNHAECVVWQRRLRQCGGDHAVERGPDVFGVAALVVADSVGDVDWVRVVACWYSLPRTSDAIK